jgi:hypothetical protein
MTEATMTFLDRRAGRDGLQRGHDGRDVPAAPEREARRPNNAPAYYLGRPAAVWISAMRPGAPGLTGPRRPAFPAG